MPVKPPRKPSARKKLEVGAQFECSGNTVTIVEVDCEVKNYKGVVTATNGVKVRFRGSEQVWERSYAMRTLKPLGTERARQDRYKAMNAQMQEIISALGFGGEREGFIAQMEKGNPCAQITLTEEGLAELHRRVMAAPPPKSALENLMS